MRFLHHQILILGVIAGIVMPFATTYSQSLITIDHPDETVIVRGLRATEVESNISKLLQQKIKEKTGKSIRVLDENEYEVSGHKYSTAIILGQLSGNALLLKIMLDLGVEFPDKKSGFKILTQTYRSKNLVVIAGADVLGVLYGVGRFLRAAGYSDGKMILPPLNEEEFPVDDSRGIYLAIHCENWYEDIPDVDKVKDLISEQGLWGANILWVWFDISMYRKGPFAVSSDSRAKWDRIKQLTKAANEIGMKVGFIEIANAAYTDQVNETNQAIGAEPPEGLLCPRANDGQSLRTMDNNYRDLYRDLRESGIMIDAISLFFYDRGGCHCDLCRPWVATGIDYVAKSRAATVHEYFPKCDIYLNDWHFEKNDGVDEVAWTKNYLKSSDTGWIRGIHKDDRHASNRWIDIDKKYEVATFFDISMVGGWGGFGANPFPRRLDTFFGDMRANGIKGGMAYTEGIFDDINKVLTLQHHWGSRSSESILKEYAKWYFDADEKTQHTITRILVDMESEWSNINRSWSHQHLLTIPQLAVKERVDSMEAALPDNIKDSWRWKLIHSRANLAPLAIDISGLEGSGYDEFEAELNILLSKKTVDEVAVNRLIEDKKKWLVQKFQQFDREYNLLYYGIYEEMKVGMYGGIPPEPGRWIEGFNRGEKWKELFDRKDKM